jgi:predicted transposase/invertase (TIGR01784 family)
MAHKILSAKMDFMFKQIFGNPNNADILAAFLLSVLDLPREAYAGLMIVDPHLQKEFEDDKLGILDVKVKTADGNLIDVEIQILPIAHIRERVIFYTSKMVTEQIASGSKYYAIKRVVSIVITNYRLLKDGVYHHCFRLLDTKTGLEFTNLIEVDVLELPKLPERDEGELWAWLRFLSATREEELNMLAERNAEMGKAVGGLMKLSADEQTRLLYEAREKAWRDAEDRLEYAHINGWQRGHAEGRAEGHAEGEITRAVVIAKNLLRRGRSIEDVAEDTGLSVAEVEGLV